MTGSYVSEARFVMDQVAIDLKEYPWNASGYAYIMNIIDSFSGYEFAIPLKNKSSHVTFKAFKLKVFCIHFKFLKMPPKKLPDYHGW